MSRHPLIGDTDRAEFCRRWAAGETLAVMAAHFGCSKPVISQTARRFGLPSRNAGGWTKTATGQPSDRDALTGGAWVPDERGIARWVPA